MPSPAFLSPSPLRFSKHSPPQLRPHSLNHRPLKPLLPPIHPPQHLHPLLPNPPPPKASALPPHSEQDDLAPASTPPSPFPPSPHDASLAHDAVALASAWLSRSQERARDPPSLRLLRRLAADAASTRFAMRFVDRVARARSHRVAARQLASVVAAEARRPAFLGAVDAALLRVAAAVAWAAPRAVVPLAKRRMKALAGGLVVAAEESEFERHVWKMRRDGYAQNVNLLGEMVLGEEEAERRLEAALELIAREKVEYVSVKISGVTPQINVWDYRGSLARVEEKLVRLFRAAKSDRFRTFVNVDMEAYEELGLSVDAFVNVLGREEFMDVDAGIVIQAYLPDALPAIQRLVAWSNDRFDRGGGAQIKIRLVKGANLAMERVTAAMQGWHQAPFESKAETDANYLRCIDWLLESPTRIRSVRVGIASHNLFAVAYARLVSLRNGVTARVGFEMLQGMVPAQAAVLREANENGLLLYTPIVAREDYDVAISYLFRRLEENSAENNFLRSMFRMKPGNDAFQVEAARFYKSVVDKDSESLATVQRRKQERPASSAYARKVDGESNDRIFTSEPNTDPCATGSKEWVAKVLDSLQNAQVRTPATTDSAEVDEILARANRGSVIWHDMGKESRRDILYAAADELARRRGELIATMMVEGSKIFSEADAEVSEAIDFARYYADRGVELPENFRPLGVFCVVSPWNYPVAIPCGGVVAALAAGNAAILKPAPETPHSAELVFECLQAAGVPKDTLQFVRVPENQIGKQLICSTDGVILTGAAETATFFKSWKPRMRLFAETSGKNAMIVTPSADIDLAVSDLVYSAFGHAGQKCSASSLCIVVGDLRRDDRFFRQLKDAVNSLAVGPSTDIASVVGPLISSPSQKLARALTVLDEGESWLVKPKCIDKDVEGRLWRPGVKIGVRNMSWFQQTECFGPVLGVVFANSLTEAISIQNNSQFGLTAGLHSLDPGEISYWKDHALAGNLYINRETTGAIVSRQPFGGWKRSSVGPGAQAGGRNYVQQLGMLLENRSIEKTSERKHSMGQELLAEAIASDAVAWESDFSKEIDDSGLFCESNVHRYRKLQLVIVRVSCDAMPWEVDRVSAAISRWNIRDVLWSYETQESINRFEERIKSRKLPALLRIRVIGSVEQDLVQVSSAIGAEVVDAPVVSNGRFELLHYCVEQTVSQKRHRFGNLIQ